MRLPMDLDRNDRRKKFKVESEPLASIVRETKAIGKDNVGALQSERLYFDHEHDHGTNDLCQYGV